jgi:hypothetical protein
MRHSSVLRALFLAAIIVATQAMTRASEKPADAQTPAQESVDASLIDNLREIAQEKRALDDFECSLMYSTGEMRTPINVGDEAPGVSIRIRKGVVEIAKHVVSELRQAGPASVPVFTSRSAILDVSETEIRQLSGLLATAGLTPAKKKGFSWSSDKQQQLRVDVRSNGHDGALDLDLTNETERKRVGKLVDLVNAICKRPEQRK